METNVVLCDDCHNVVAKRKCQFCGKDLCNDCRRTMSIRRFRNNYNNDDLDIVMCGECLREYDKVEIDKGFFKNLGRGIIKHLKKQAILKTLEDNKKNGKEK